jgi:hypothetical protein
MAVVEYKLEKSYDSGSYAPLHIKSGGYQGSPLDQSLIGWSDSLDDVELTRSMFIDRMLKIHETHPLKKGAAPGAGTIVTEFKDLTEKEVISTMGDWYDAYVAENIGNVSLDDIKARKKKYAFDYMTSSLSNSVVKVTTAAGEVAFGCDEITTQNLLNLNSLINSGSFVGVPSWTPKGATKAISLTKEEVSNICTELLKKKDNFYTVYFGHKDKIMSSNDVKFITNYDHALGY